MFFMRRFSLNLLRFLWKLWLWLCLLASFSVLLLALLFPRLPEYRTQIEQWISQVLEQPIVIGNLETYWVDWQPTVALQQVRLLDAHGEQNVVEIAYAEIVFNLWESIQQAQLMTNSLVLNGIQLKLARNQEGHIRLVGLPEQGSTDKTIGLQWLLQQPEISFHTTMLTWLEPSQPPFVFSNLQLAVEQQTSGYRITGQVDLPQQLIQGISAKTVSFVMQVNNAQPFPIDGEFAVEQLQFVAKSSLPPVFQALQGKFAVSQHKDGSWQITIKQHLVNFAQQQWLPHEISVQMVLTETETQFLEQIGLLVSKTNESNLQNRLEISGSIKAFSLESLLSQLPPKVFNQVSSQFLDTLKTTRGTLHDIQWKYTPNHWRVRTHFMDLTMPAQGQVPGISDSSGQIDIMSSQGKLLLDKGAVTFNLPGLTNSPVSLTQLQGELKWQRAQEQWHLTTSTLQAIDKKTKMQVQVVGSVDIPFSEKGGLPDSNLKVTLRNGQLSSLLKYLPVQNLPKEVVRQLNQAQLEGYLNQAQLLIKGKGKQTSFELKGHIKNVHFLSVIPDSLLSTKIPKRKLQNKDKTRVAIQGLSGHLDITPDKGTFRLEQASVTVNLPNWYSHPLSLTRLKGTLNWQRNQEQWHLNVQKLQAFDHKMKIQMNGYVDIPRQGGVPYSNLSVTLHNGQLAQIPHYIPDQESPKLAHWFNQTQLRGRLNNAHILIQGPIDRIFDSKLGRFELKANVNKTELNYAPGWPRLKHVKAKVFVEGRSLTISIARGRILNSRVRNIVVKIADLSVKPVRLMITGRTQGPAADGLHFVAQSPLRDQLDLKRLEANGGHIDVHFKLIIPLSKEPNQVQGSILFQDTTVHDKSLDLTLTEIAGLLNFTDERVSAQNMQGKLLDHPVHFSILTLRKKHPKRTTVKLTSFAEASLLFQQLKRFNPELAQLPLPFVSGKTHWNVTLNFPNEKVKGNNYIDIRLETDLKGIDINLPAPLTKTAQERRNVRVNVHLSEEETSILVRVRYDNLFNGIFRLNNTGLETGTLILGTTPAQLPKQPQLNIEGYLPSFSITAWLNVLHSQNGKTKQKAFPIPLLMDLHFGHLEMLGQTFTNLALHAKYAQSQWNAAITGTHLEGQITFNTSPNAPTLELNFRELQLSLPKNETKEATKKPKKIPPDPHTLPLVSFHCDDLRIDDLNLGNVDLHTQPHHDGLKIILKSQAIGFNLQAELKWRYVIQRHQSILQATLNSDNIGIMLQQLGYPNPPLVGEQSRITLNAYWFDAPYAVELSTLTGTLNLVSLEGNIVEVEPGSVSRLFGLFDVYTLPSRLALDFSDVFEQGFGFNTIVGSFFIKQGIASTKYFILQAPSARIEINGQTDLVNKYYDQIVTVFPHFSNPLPIAGALMGGLSGGLAALVIQKMLQTELKQVINFQYHITGPWKKPKIVSIPQSRVPTEK